MSKYSKFLAVFSYFFFSAGTSALGFIAAMLMMRFMPPEEFGRLALFFSLQFVAVPMVSFAADNLIAINKSKLSIVDYDHFRRSYVTFAYLMFTLVLISFYVLYIIGILNDLIFILIPIFGLVRFIISMASIEYVMEELSVQYGKMSFFTTLTSLILTFIFLSLLSGVAEWRIFALLIADLIFVILRYKNRLNLLLTFSFDKKIIKDISKFGFPLLLAVAPAWALNESDKIIVAKYTDLASVGYYSVACTIGGIMVTFNTAVLNTMIPKIYENLIMPSEHILIITKKYLNIFLLATTCFGVIFAFIYGLSSEFLLPEKYADARKIVYIIILLSLFRGIYAVLATITDYYQMTVVKLKGIIYGGITAVITSIMGVLKFGIIGAAVGVGLGYLVLSLVLWIALARKSSFTYKLF